MSASIAEFVRLLHQGGVGSPDAKRYRASYPDDADFQRRAETAEMLFKNRRSVLKALEGAEAKPPRQPAEKPPATRPGSVLPHHG